MSSVLLLASEFIDRMVNPAYGIRVNEEFAIRLSTLQSSEEWTESKALITREATRLRKDDFDVLTSYGWQWMTRWARSNDVELDGTLLLILVEHWSNIFMIVPVIDLATRNAKWKARKRVASVSSFKHAWLKKLLIRCVEQAGERKENRERTNTELPLPHQGFAETVLFALLQVGNDVSLDAASTLLHHDWTGKENLLEAFRRRCELLDAETQEIWLKRLNLKGRSPN